MTEFIGSWFKVVRFLHLDNWASNQGHFEFKKANLDVW